MQESTFNANSWNATTALGHSFHKPEVSYYAVDEDLVELSVLLEIGSLAFLKNPDLH